MLLAVNKDVTLESNYDEVFLITIKYRKKVISLFNYKNEYLYYFLNIK